MKMVSAVAYSRGIAGRDRSPVGNQAPKVGRSAPSGAHLATLVYRSRRRLSGASRLQQALSLRPRVRKLATGPSSRSKFSSGAAAPRSLKLFISCSRRRRRAGMIIPPPTKFRVPGRNQVSPGRASDVDAESAAQEAPRLRRKPPGLPQSRCSAAARPYPAAHMMRSVADGSR